MVINVHQVYLIAFNSLNWLSLLLLLFGRRWIFNSELWSISFYMKVDNTSLIICWLWWLRWLWFNFNWLVAFCISTIIIPTFSFICKLYVWWWKQIELLLWYLWWCIEFWFRFTHCWVTEVTTCLAERWGIHSCIHLFSIVSIDLDQLFLNISLSWYCLELNMLVP